MELELLALCWTSGLSLCSWRILMLTIMRLPVQLTEVCAPVLVFVLLALISMNIICM